MVKHVGLGLCTKRKTGSRRLISWLNCLGYSISYHGINLVKTHITEEQIVNVITHNYVLNNVRPENIYMRMVISTLNQCMEGLITVRIPISSSKNPLTDLSRLLNLPQWLATTKKVALKPIINSIELVAKLPCLDPKLIFNGEIENDIIYAALDKTEGLVLWYMRPEVSARNQN